MPLSYRPPPEPINDTKEGRSWLLKVLLTVCVVAPFVAQVHMAFASNSTEFSSTQRDEDALNQYIMMPLENRHPVSQLEKRPTASEGSRDDSVQSMDEQSPNRQLPIDHVVKRHTPTETIRHGFVRSADKNFVAIDRYIVELPHNGGKPGGATKKTVAVLGDGIVPLRIEAPTNGDKRETVVAEFTCSMGKQTGTKARIILMRGHESLRYHYFEKKSYKVDKSPFSGNGDKFRTMIIFCEELDFDEENATVEPLILSSSNFTVTVDSPFVVNPTPEREDKTDQSRQLTAVHCICPAYGQREPHWLIEYIEHHLAAGVSHLHLYNYDMFSDHLQSAIKEYQKQGVISHHDWSLKSSEGYTRGAYEHAKWAASTDCLLRSRGQFDFALFSDIDEVWLGDVSREPQGDVQPGLLLCQRARDESNGVKIGCGIHSSTISSVFTKLSPSEQEVAKSKLLLERYSRKEAHPNCPGNCYCERGARHPTDPNKRICLIMNRKYQMGRQKFVFSLDLSIEPIPLFTHAISRDMEEMDRIMAIVPDEHLHVRHYQGHWLARTNKLETLEEIEAPVPRHILNTIRHRIQNSDILSSIYNAHASNGVEWITPIERSPILQTSGGTETLKSSSNNVPGANDDLASRIVRGEASLPDGNSPVKFRPGELSKVAEADALNHCYIDREVYKQHFHRSDNMQVSVSEKHKLMYIFVPKSGSSTSRYMMKERFGATERTRNAGEFGDDAYSNYTIFSFVRDPLARFFSSYDEAYARSAPWATKRAHPVPYLHEGFDSYQDYEDVFCPPHTRKKRGECTKRQSQENGTLAARLTRFAMETDGRSPFDVHIKLQVPMLSLQSNGRPMHLDALFNTTAANIGWESLAASHGINLSVPLSDGLTGVIRGRTYPRRFRIELITNATKQRICELGMLDYCCLNLPLPPPCSDLYCRLDRSNDRLRIHPWAHPQSATKSN